MDYQKDKELMQEIHNLIDDYNYLNKVIPIIKETYIKERINFYVQTYQTYADILKYQLNLINNVYETNFVIKDIININYIENRINDLFLDLNFTDDTYFKFNDIFENKMKSYNDIIMENIDRSLKKIQHLFFNETLFNNLIKFKTEKPNHFIFLNLNLIKFQSEINFEFNSLIDDTDYELNSVLHKIKLLKEFNFFEYDIFTNKFLAFFHHDFFNDIKNKLYNDNIIDDYEIKNTSLLKLIGINFNKKYNTYDIDNFFINSFISNKALSKFLKYIEQKYDSAFDKLSILKDRKNLEGFLSNNNYLFLFFFDDFENFNFKPLLYLLKYLDIDSLINYFNKLPQEYKDLFNENLVRKFDNQSAINPFRKLQLNNKLNKTITNNNIKEKPNKI